jgi:hypothetical protein
VEKKFALTWVVIISLLSKTEKKNLFL